MVAYQAMGRKWYVPQYYYSRLILFMRPGTTSLRNHLHHRRNLDRFQDLIYDPIFLLSFEKYTYIADERSVNFN